MILIRLHSSFPQLQTTTIYVTEKEKKIIMTLSVPSSMTLISAFIFRREGKGFMKFKTNIEVNLKELNKPLYICDGGGKTDKRQKHRYLLAVLI